MILRSSYGFTAFSVAGYTVHFIHISHQHGSCCKTTCKCMFSVQYTSHTCFVVMKGRPSVVTQCRCVLQLWSPVFNGKGKMQIGVMNGLIISSTELIMLYMTVNTVNKWNSTQVCKKNNRQDKYRVFLLLLYQARQYCHRKPASARRSHDRCNAQDSDRRHTHCYTIRIIHVYFEQYECGHLFMSYLTACIVGFL
jgi:hypothetical protein